MTSPTTVPSNWTDARVMELRRLDGLGLTFAEIARQLKVTRNAAIGKAHRLGLIPRGKAVKTAALWLPKLRPIPEWK